MKKNNFKNILKTLIISLSVFLLEINNSFAATDNGLAGTLSFKETANNITNNVLTSATTLLMTAAFVVFFAGVVLFMYHRSSGEDAKLAKDREAMLWGLLALFVMVSVWGIIKLVQGFFGIQNDNNIQVQSVAFLAPASSGTTQVDAKPASATDTTNKVFNKAEGESCIGQPGSATQCVSGLFCRDANKNTVATGAYGTCQTSAPLAATNRPQGANCVGQSGSAIQCASGLSCRDSNGDPVATGGNGTCVSQYVAKPVTPAPTSPLGTVPSFTQ
jgi:succinate dehydrogenase/fumarate reductase cytochrome b subunit